MTKFAYLPEPTLAVELGISTDPNAAGRKVTLFAGMLGTLENYTTESFSIFTVAQSGARYVIYTENARVAKCSGVKKSLLNCGRPAHAAYRAIGENPRALCAAHGKSNWARAMGLKEI